MCQDLHNPQAKPQTISVFQLRPVKIYLGNFAIPLFVSRLKHQGQVARQNIVSFGLNMTQNFKYFNRGFPKFMLTF